MCNFCFSVFFFLVCKLISLIAKFRDDVLLIIVNNFEEWSIVRGEGCALGVPGGPSWPLTFAPGWLENYNYQ